MRLPQERLSRTTCHYLHAAAARRLPDSKTSAYHPVATVQSARVWVYGRVFWSLRLSSLTKDARGGWAISLWGRSAYVPRPRLARAGKR